MKVIKWSISRIYVQKFGKKHNIGIQVISQSEENKGAKILTLSELQTGEWDLEVVSLLKRLKNLLKIRQVAFLIVKTLLVGKFSFLSHLTYCSENLVLAGSELAPSTVERLILRRKITSN